MGKPAAFASTTVLTVLLSACAGQDAPAPKAPTAPAAAPAAAPAPAPVAKEDPYAINAAIPADAFKAKLTLGGQAPSQDGKGTTYQLQVKNEGTVPLYGTGKYPVTVGATILGSTGSADRDGGVRDFVRESLPLALPGQSVTVNVTVPSDPRLKGHKLRFSLVQEGIAWHEEASALVDGAKSN